MTVAFWPSLEDSDALSSFDDMEALLEAFGAQNIATPAGYLDGQLYALMLPLLLSGMAIAGITSLTSGDEDSGRIELLHALPVSRRSIWLGRLTAAMSMLAVVTIVTGSLMLASRLVFSFAEVPPGRIAAASIGCALLAAFHAAIAFAAGGAGSRRGTAIGIAVLILVGGYVLNFVVPLADALAWSRQASPWYWAIGEQPVSEGVSASRLTALGAVAAIVVWSGTVAVERRDIRSA